MRLNTRPVQWIVSGLLIVWCGALAVVLPRVSENATAAQSTALTAGAAVSQGGVSIVPADGWTQVSNPIGLILQKQALQVDVFPPAPATQTPLKAVEAAAAATKADKSTTYQIGKPRTFKTASGLDAAELVVLSPGDVNVTYAFSDGKQATSVIVSTTDASWKSLQKEIKDMMSTVAFTAAGAGS